MGVPFKEFRLILAISCISGTQMCETKPSQNRRLFMHGFWKLACESVTRAHLGVKLCFYPALGHQLDFSCYQAELED